MSEPEHAAHRADLGGAALTRAVTESFAGTSDRRLREILSVLVEHLHAAVQECSLTVEEWSYAVEFLTRVGHTCDGLRQEYVLLSDVLGVSSLVETVAQRSAGAGVTEATVLGPFHTIASPERSPGACLYRSLPPGAECVVRGRVLGTDGRPAAGATVDVWQADAEGVYDVQGSAALEHGDGRGLFTADRNGAFWFRTQVPAPYPIPTDGPVGELLAATGRHAYRPAHIHFIASAPGHTEVTTHIFVADSPYLDSDAVFAVKSGLVREFRRIDDRRTAAGYGVPAPFRLAEIDLVLQREERADG
jgi:protocatechuate 3,4-dioxygenase beta subunit